MSIKKFLTFIFLQISQIFATEDSLRIIFAGDIMGHVTQINAAKTKKGYDYKPVFKHLKSYFSSADLAVINLEHTLAGEPYSGYPQFSSPDESIFGIKDAGFDLIATANNHSLDRGKQGLERTLKVLDSIELKHFGIYRDTAEKMNKYPLFIEKNGIKLAFLNYTYGTNMLVEEAPNIVNRIDTTEIAADIRKAKQGLPDFVIAFMHWGAEYENVQNKEQKDLARFLARKGVNIIIGSHPHVVQPFEKIYIPGIRDSVPVIYSLGNFFSNQRERYTNGGIIFELTLKKTKIADYNYLPFFVYRFENKNKDSSGKYTFRLLPDCRQYPKICKEYKINSDYKKEMERFFDDTKKTMGKVPISPIQY